MLGLGFWLGCVSGVKRWDGGGLVESREAEQDQFASACGVSVVGYCDPPHVRGVGTNKR